MLKVCVKEGHSPLQGHLRAVSGEGSLETKCTLAESQGSGDAGAARGWDLGAAAGKLESQLRCCGGPGLGGALSRQGCSVGE